MPYVKAAAAAEFTFSDSSIVKHRSTSASSSSTLSVQHHIFHQQHTHPQGGPSQALTNTTNLPSPSTSDSDQTDSSASHKSIRNLRKAPRSLRRSRLSSFASRKQSLPVSPPDSDSDGANRQPKNDENCADLGALHRRRPLRFAFPDGPADDTSPPLQESSNPTREKPDELDPWPFPLQPLPVILAAGCGSTDRKEANKSNRRCFSSGVQYQTSSITPDRFIPDHSASRDAASTFRISKRANELSSSERLVRHNTASQDPFDSPTSARVGRRHISTNQASDLGGVASRTASGTNLLSPWANAANVQARQFSTGAVWNVGGSAATTPTAPIVSVTDGRGGFVGSGTNAPIYTSRFFERESSELNRGRLERRLAAALEVDPTTRVLNHSGSPDRGRSRARGAISSNSRSLGTPKRTAWEDGQWVRPKSLSRKHITSTSVASAENTLYFRFFHLDLLIVI